MPDFNRLTDAVWGLIGNSASVPDAPLGDITAALANAGLDIGALQGIAPDQLIPFLAEHGVDINSFAPDQIASLASSLGFDGALDGPVSDLLGQMALDRLSNR